VRGLHTDHHDDPAHQRVWRRCEALPGKAATTSFQAEADACRHEAE
jgi:hypothetical protein